MCKAGLSSRWAFLSEPLGKVMPSANDAHYDGFVLFFSADQPPRVQDTVNPFTLLSWAQMGNELRVNSCVMDEHGQPRERSMKVDIWPNNEHAIQTLQRWLPSGKRLSLIQANEAGGV